MNNSGRLALCLTGQRKSIFQFKSKSYQNLTENISISNIPGNASRMNVAKYTFDINRAHTAFDAKKYQVQYRLSGFGDVMLYVTCGQNFGLLYVSKLKLGSKGILKYF